MTMTPTFPCQLIHITIRKHTAFITTSLNYHIFQFFYFGRSLLIAIAIYVICFALPTPLYVLFLVSPFFIVFRTIIVVQLHVRMTRPAYD